MKDTVNIKIKFCEPFRPFAPSVPAERTEECFTLAQASRHYPARFMLYAVDVVPQKRHSIPAVTHVDGSGRLQTVRKEWSPRYYRLIETFGQATGVPGRAYSHRILLVRLKCLSPKRWEEPGGEPQVKSRCYDLPRALLRSSA